MIDVRAQVSILYTQRRVSEANSFEGTVRKQNDYLLFSTQGLHEGPTSGDYLFSADISRQRIPYFRQLTSMQGRCPNSGIISLRQEQYATKGVLLDTSLRVQRYRIESHQTADAEARAGFATLR